MPNFTKKAIKISFMKLISEHPLNEISVRSIVEDCGINRNSFYYHFKDIPSLIEEIVMDHFNLFLQQYPHITDLNDGFRTAFLYMIENKKAMSHIYNSVNRDIFEKYLMDFCESIIKSYLETVFTDVKISESDKNLIERFLKCTLFGAYIDWMNCGMPESIVCDTERIIQICHGFSDEIIRRCTAYDA